MDAVIGLPEQEDARALRVREPGPGCAGVALFNTREWRRRGTPQAERSPAWTGTRGSRGAAAARRRALVRGGDLRRVRGRASIPGSPGGVESFVSWPVADWALGCDVRGREGAALGGRRASPPPRCRTSGRPGRCSSSIPWPVSAWCAWAPAAPTRGWMLKPGGWPDLSDAVLDARGERDAALAALPRLRRPARFGRGGRQGPPAAALPGLRAGALRQPRAHRDGDGRAGRRRGDAHPAGDRAGAGDVGPARRVRRGRRAPGAGGDPGASRGDRARDRRSAGLLGIFPTVTATGRGHAQPLLPGAP